MSYREEVEDSVHAIVTELPEWDAEPGDAIHEAAGNLDDLHRSLSPGPAGEPQ